MFQTNERIWENGKTCLRNRNVFDIRPNKSDSSFVSCRRKYSSDCKWADHHSHNDNRPTWNKLWEFHQKVQCLFATLFIRFDARIGAHVSVYATNVGINVNEMRQKNRWMNINIIERRSSAAVKFEQVPIECIPVRRANRERMSKMKWKDSWVRSKHSLLFE